MAASTRPLTLGEILDRTVQLYRRNFLLFAGISFLPSAIYVVVAGAAGIYFSSQVPLLPQATPPNLQAMLALGRFLLLFCLIGLPLLLVILAVALSALNYAAFQRNRGDAVTLRAAYAYGFRHFWRHVGILFLQFLFAGAIPGFVFAVVLFGAAIVTALFAASTSGKPFAILSGLLIIVLVVAMWVVCVWIWLRFCLAYPASVTEERKAWPSLQRSAQLSKGSRGRIFVMYLMVAIMTVIAYYVLTLPVDIALKLTVYKSMGGMALLTKPPILLQVVNLFVNCLERTFAMPIYAIALLLFYNDQRTRQEGYDIELLMANAGWPQLPQLPAAPPPPIPTSPEPPAPLQEPIQAEIAPLHIETVYPEHEGTDA